MATTEELQQKIDELEIRIIALERSLFSTRHGASDKAISRTIPKAG